MSEEQAAPKPLAISITHSPAFGELVKALAKATLAFDTVLKDADNPFFKSKYADLSNYINATRKPLAENNLVLTQMPGEASGNRVTVTTMLLHTSSEWLRSDIVMPCGKPDAQGVGSALTYGRRYGYGAMLNLTGELDDDAEGSIPSHNKEIRAEQDSKIEKQGRIAQFQATELHARAKKFSKTEEEIKAFLGELGFVQFEEVTKEHFNNVLKFLSNASPAKKAAEPKAKTMFPACIAHGVVNCEECA